MNPVVLFLIIAAVIGVAMMMRSSGGKDSGTSSSDDDRASSSAEGLGSSTSVLDDDEESLADHEDMSVPITAEGIALLPDGHELRLLPLIESEEVPDGLQSALDSSSIPYSVLNRIYLPAAPRGMRGTKPGTPLNVGDFTAARIRAGVAGSYAWRLETLGRDGDFGFFPFTERSGAEAALGLLEKHGILSKTADEEGNPSPPSAEDFEEARRRYEETESALALDADDDETPRGDSWSDRR